MVMLVSEGNGLWLPLTPEYLIQLTSYLPDVAKMIIFYLKNLCSLISHFVHVLSFLIFYSSTKPL